MLTLGAAAENLVLSAHHAGWSVRLDPFPGSEPLVAAFRFYDRPIPGAEPHAWDDLQAAIGTRCTNRRRSARMPLPDGAREAIAAAVRSVPGVALQFVEAEEDLAEIGRLIGAGDRLRMLHERLHAEMMGEVRWTRAGTEQTRDGLSLETLELRSSEQAGLQVCRHPATVALLRQWGGGGALGRLSAKAVDSAAAVGLVTMPAATPAAYFDGGRAVQRAWLTATRRGIAFQPMTVLPYLFARLLRGGGAGLDEAEIATLRGVRERYLRLFDLTDTTGEIMLFRVALADAPSERSLRRPVAEVLEFA